MIKERETGNMKQEMDSGTRDQLREYIEFLRENGIDKADIARELAEMNKGTGEGLDNDDLREKMKLFIEVNGLRREYVAEELLGLAVGHFSKFLNGKRTMGDKSLQRVANLLDTYEVTYKVL